jgi:hypothetical protein
MHRSNTHSNAHTPCPTNQPTPYRRTTAPGIQGKRKSGHDRSKQPANTNSKRESRQIAKLALENRIVSELRRQLGIGLTQILDTDGFALSVGAIDLDQANTLSALAKDAVIADVVGADFSHDGGVFVPRGEYHAIERGRGVRYGEGGMEELIMEKRE